MYNKNLDSYEVCKKKYFLFATELSENDKKVLDKYATSYSDFYKSSNTKQTTKYKNN